MAPAPPDQQTQVEPEHFEARTTLSNGMSAAVGSAAAGVFVSAIQNSISSHDKGAMGVFTRSGSTIGLFAAMGGIFALTDSFVANAREKSDAYNGAAGGCAAGLVAGANARSIPMMFGSCAALAALVGTFDAAGKSLTGSYAQGAPGLSGGVAAEHGTALEGDAGHGQRGWREEREARRKSFFKQKKTADIDTE